MCAHVCKRVRGSHLFSLLWSVHRPSTDAATVHPTLSQVDEARGWGSGLAPRPQRERAVLQTLFWGSPYSCGPQLRLTAQRTLHVPVEKRCERGQLARPPSASQPRHIAVPPGRSHRPHGLHGRAVKRPRPVQHVPDTSHERSERCLCLEPG